MAVYTAVRIPDVNGDLPWRVNVHEVKRESVSSTLVARFVTHDDAMLFIRALELADALDFTSVPAMADLS